MIDIGLKYNYPKSVSEEFIKNYDNSGPIWILDGRISSK